MATRVVKVEFDTKDASRAAREAAGEFKTAFDKIRPAASGAQNAVGGVTSKLSGLSTAVKGFAALGFASILNNISSGLTAVAAASLKAATDLDKTRSTLRALTGSTESANAKIAELRQLAASAPGVTTKLATDTFSQLKAIGTVTDQTINNLIKSVGKLNAVFSIDDVQGFTRNLTQIFNQGFERADIKEALGRVPIFEQLLEQAFGTKDPEKLRKLKETGKLTIDTFLGGFADGVSNDARFKGVTESLGGRFEKIKDQILTSLAPIGDQLANLLEPAIKRIAPRIEQIALDISSAFSANRPDIERFTDSMFRLLDALGKLKPLFGVLLEAFKLMAENIRLIADVISSLVNNVAKLANSFGALKDLALGSNKNPVIFKDGRFVELANEAPRDRIGNQIRSEFGGPGVNSPIVFGNQGLANRLANPLGLNFDLIGQAATALNNRPDPVKTEKKKDSEIRALRQAQLQFEREQAEQLTRIEQDRIRRAIEDNKFEFDQKTKTVGQFFEERRLLNEQLVQVEISGIQRELKEVEQARAKTKASGAERIRLDTEILKLQTDLVLKQKELGRIAVDNSREFREELQKVFTQDRTRRQRGQVSVSTLSRPLTIEEAFSQVQTDESERLRRNEETDKRAREAILAVEQQREAIQNDIFRGVISEAEGRRQILAVQRQIADIERQRLETEQKITLDPERQAQIRLELERLKNIGQDLKPAEAFFKGLNNETELLSEKLENLGRNFRDTFVDSLTTLLATGKNTFGNLFNVVKVAIARMSAELIASQLFRFFATGQASGGGGGFTTPGINPGARGGSSGGLGGILGSIFGGGGGGGVGGFLTPPFVPNFATAGGGPIPGANNANLLRLLGSGSSGNVPLSTTTSSQIGGLSNDTAVARAAIAAGASPVRGTGFGAILGAFGSNLKNLFKGVGFGKTPGSAGGLAGALPLLGLTFGSQAGGGSILGQILGGAGGVLAGIGLTAAPAGLAASSPALAALFSNPIIAIAGAGLLVGAIFLGRASQRRKDEHASGDFLQQAIDGIAQLREAVSTDQITGAQARASFNSDILGTFRAQINTIKTKSVRESRLTNQVRDLQNLFESSVGPEITKQAERQRVGSRLIPEFASGGIIPGIDRGYDSTLIKARPGEMVLTRAQQQQIAMMSANPGIFAAAGVPSAGSVEADGIQGFAGGGTVQGSTIVLGPDAFDGAQITLVAGQEDISRLLVSPAGRRATTTNVKRSRQSRRLS